MVSIRPQKRANEEYTMTKEQKKWDAWYFQSKTLFAELFDSPQDVFNYIWYKIAKQLNRILTGRSKSAICHDVLGDMMLRLEGNNRECHRIMQDVLDDNSVFWSMESKYDLSWRGNELSDNWLERLQDLDNNTVLKLAERAMPWLSWHEPYTLQYARCWAQKYGCPDALHPERTEIPYEEDYLAQVRETIRKNEGLPLDALLLTEPIAIIGESGYPDRESLFMDLMNKGLRYDVAFFLELRLRKGQTLWEDEEAVIREVLPSDRVVMLLNARYIPPRSNAAKRLLACVDLI